MVGKYYTATVRYDKVDEHSGKEVTVSEPYLIDALSFTEAEERIHREMEAYISGDFDVSGLKREKYEEIICGSPQFDIWFKAVVRFISCDENSGKEKAVKINFLINSDTLQSAIKDLEERQKDVIVPWSLYSIIETPILDVFFYQQPEDEKKEKQ